MVNILNKDSVFAYIDKFNTECKTQFGVMTPQHIVEHLAMSLHIATGKLRVEFTGNVEMAEKIKQKLIYTDTELPQGIKNPILKDEPNPYVYKTIDEAKAALKDELELFYKYKSENPNATHVHPRMNVLTIDEWVIMQSKHFTHHFKQVGLV